MAALTSSSTSMVVWPPKTLLPSGRVRSSTATSAWTLVPEADGTYKLIRVDRVITAADAQARTPAATSIETDLVSQLVGDLRTRFAPSYNADLAARMRNPGGR